MTDLTRKCLYLSRQDRKRLIKILTESLEEDKLEDDGSRFAILYKAATEVCGQGILTSLRNFNLVMGRRMIAYRMRLEGYSLPTIGRHLIRHHASVMHMIKMMDDVMTFNFPLEMGYWNMFQQKIKEYDIHDRTTQGS